MTKHPYFSSRNTPVKEALKFMRQKGFRHLPVVENKKVVGIVSDRNLKEAESFADTMHLTLADVMSTEPYCIDTKTPLSDVLQTMVDRKIGSAIVLNNVGSVAGIFTSVDAMKILSNILDRAYEDTSFEPNMEQFVSGNFFI